MKTEKEVRDLVECPDCHGFGTHHTPAKNWNRTVMCATCRGAGYVNKYDAERLAAEDKEA